VSAPYEAIVVHFRGLIASGELKPGEQLPTIRDIADAFEVSRATATRAIASLRALGLVTTHGRAGTLVAENTLSYLTRMVIFPPDLWEWLQAQSIERRVSFSDIVVELLQPAFDAAKATP